MAETTEQGVGTRERLLEAASQVFAEKGFRRATVREIVQRADANLNAINYHFGDKEGLYVAVIEFVHHQIDAKHNMAGTIENEPDPCERLRMFVGELLRRALTRQSCQVVHKLMAMEMAEPSVATDIVVERFIRPRFELLKSIVHDIAGDQLSDVEVALCAESVVGQCIHLVHARPIVSRLLPEFDYSESKLQHMTDHVTAFSLAALRTMADQGEAR